MTAKKPLQNRIAFVSGASRGLGRAVAIGLARAGAHVIITARTTGALEEVDDEIRALGGTATLVQLDLKQGDRIDQLGPSIYQRWGRLDILVANAGILGPLSPLAHVTADSWTSVIDTNLNANWRLIRTFDPLLKLSDAGRVILISSGAADGRHAYWGPYAVSKAALETLGKTYALEVASTPVRVAIVNPGGMRTQMRQKAFPGEDPKTLPSPEDVAPLIVELALPASTLNGEIVNFHSWKDARKPAPAAAEPQ